MEKHFKNKLKQHKVDWDKEDLLDGLESSLSQKKSPSQWKWLLFLLPLLVMVTCWTYYKNDLSDTFSNDLSKTKIIEDNYEISTKEIINTTTDVSSEEMYDDLMVRKRKVEEESNQPLTEYKDEIKRQSKRVIQKNIISDGLVDSNVGITPDNNRLIANSDLINKSTDEVLSKKALLVSPTVIDETKTQRLNKKSANINPINLTTKNLNLVTEKFLFHEPVIEVNKEPVEVESKYEDKEKESKKYAFYAESIFEIGLPNRQEKYKTSDALIKTELEANKDMEDPKVLFVMGVQLGVSIKDKWMFQLGAEYYMIRELFQLEDTWSDTFYAEYDKAAYFLDDNMDTMYFAGISPFVENQDRKVRHWNSFQYYNIPLNISRRFAFGKFGLNPSIGISYAFNNDFTGRNNSINMDGTNQIVDDPTFKLKNRFGFQLGIGGEYKISDRRQLFLKTSLRKSPTFEQQGYEQTYWMYSIGVGVRYFLGDL